LDEEHRRTFTASEVAQAASAVGEALTSVNHGHLGGCVMTAAPRLSAWSWDCTALASPTMISESLPSSTARFHAAFTSAGVSWAMAGSIFAYSSSGSPLTQSSPTARAVVGVVWSTS